ncbi:MAG: hybrid sensor histidine kinase/response regulator [Desulfosoma sp.]|uniref:hybrid sensor histidine kinase/response regulator n=1 Tax=Desulfosoma sp. TaxID=2603217 RepID=UPI00404953BB
MGETPDFHRLAPPGLSATVGHGFLYLMSGLALSVWTLVCFLFLWNLDAQEKRHIEQSAHTHALTLVEKDKLYRLWNALHGGVYVAVGPNLAPNPYLHVPERDIETPSGKKLTLVNPAYMTRMVHELGRGAGNSSAHITGLEPINPANAPDPWEKKALEWFTTHAEASHYAEKVSEEAGSVIKVMVPLRLEPPCLRCHNTALDMEGRVRGGIAVTVPLKTFDAPKADWPLYYFKRFVFIWLTGLIGILVGFWVARGRIAERRVFLSTLAAKEQLWRSICEGMQDPLVVLDRDFRIRMINSAAAALAQTTPKEAEGKSCTEVFSYWHKLSGACADKECAARQVLKTGTARSSHMEILLPDGSSRVFHVLVSPLLEQDAAVSGVIESFRDITEEARAQHELAKEKRDLDLLFENMFGGCALHEMMTDEHGAPVDYRFLKVNAAFAEHTGLPAKNIIGKTVREILPDSYDRWVRRYAPTALAGKPVAFEDFEPVLGRHFSVRAYQTEPGKFVTVFFDVTEREKLSEQLRHAQKMQAVGQLAGGVAHEFNNILQIINGYVEMVLGQTPAHDPRHGPLQRVMDSGLRAARLVQQLLAFSRKQILRPEPADINEVVRDFGKLAQKMVGETIAIRRVPGAHLGRVRIDRPLMEQVLLNLVINARDAMPSGGEIVVETADVDLDETYVLQNVQLHPGPYVMVAVADTGVGMAPEVMERIFEPFFTTKDVGQGTGLGLSVAYGIVRQHDGMIHVYSEPGKGTTFKIYLPRLVEEQEQGKGKEHLGSPSEKAPRGTGLILLAEDDPAVREYLAMALRDAGYRVVEARNGMEAVEIFATTLEPIDCVVTDVVMPGMGGEEAVGLIRRTCGWIPAVFLSGYSERMHGVAARSSPNTVYLEKPVRRSVLLRAVHELVAKGADPFMDQESSP